MNLSKSLEYFDPSKDSRRINIVGCGSVGSTVAENLARCGVSNFVLWDFDTVEPHNIVNQMFTEDDVGKQKTEALKEIIHRINPGAAVKEMPEGWSGQVMSGYIFLCVDSIELRKEIVNKHMNSQYVEAVFDFRTTLESAQHYAANWHNKEMKENLIKSMQFSHEEASEETPVSACGVTLGVATTVRLISALGVDNYINFVKGNGIKKFIMVDGFHFILDAFD